MLLAGKQNPGYIEGVSNTTSFWVILSTILNENGYAQIRSPIQGSQLINTNGSASEQKNLRFLIMLFFIGLLVQGLSVKTSEVLKTSEVWFIII
jgi:hypothetical protein